MGGDDFRFRVRVRVRVGVIVRSIAFRVGSGSALGSAKPSMGVVSAAVTLMMPAQPRPDWNIKPRVTVTVTDTFRFMVRVWFRVRVQGQGQQTLII